MRTSPDRDERVDSSIDVEVRLLGGFRAEHFGPGRSRGCASAADLSAAVPPPLLAAASGARELGTAGRRSARRGRRGGATGGRRCGRRRLTTPRKTSRRAPARRRRRARPRLLSRPAPPPAHLIPSRYLAGLASAGTGPRLRQQPRLGTRGRLDRLDRLRQQLTQLGLAFSRGVMIGHRSSSSASARAARPRDVYALTAPTLTPITSAAPASVRSP